MNGPAAAGAAGRRTVLRAGAARAGVVLSGAAGAPWAGGASLARARVYVLVIDGCRPDEITPDLTPRLHALRRHGRWYPQALALPVMETIPNHTMMMTGVRPDRTQVPANASTTVRPGPSAPWTGRTTCASRPCWSGCAGSG